MNGIAIGVAVVAFLAALGAVLFVLFVFSVGTAVDTVKVDATVLDRATRRPVGDCLLSFGLPGYPYNTQRTHMDGRVHYDTSQMYGASFMTSWFERDRKIVLTFHLGRPPRYATFEKVERWTVTMSFRKPWRAGAELTPKVSVERALDHEDYLNPPKGTHWQVSGSEPLPAVPPAEEAAAQVFYRDSNPRDAYDVRLTLLLDKDQITACQRADP